MCCSLDRLHQLFVAACRGCSAVTNACRCNCGAVKTPCQRPAGVRGLHSQPPRLIHDASSILLLWPLTLLKPWLVLLAAVGHAEATQG